MGSSAGGGLVLGILGWGVPPGSPNPDSISDQKTSFSHPFSDLASMKLSHHYLDLYTNKKDCLKFTSNLYISLSFLFLWN